MMTRTTRTATVTVLALTVFTAQAQTLRNWMSPEVGDAWKSGYKGSGTTVTVVDDFSSASKFSGNLGDGTFIKRHGEWTLKEASMIAPLATFKTQDFNLNSKAVALASTGLNVLNLSYAMYAASGYTASQIGWSPRETSIINYATNGKAVISKAAGNDAVAIGAANASGKVDYLNLALKGTASAIYVGALSTNGSTVTPASLAYYSNYAGTDAAVQKQFLVVGVDSSKTGFAGTSFAAPVISGYSAILGSKFRTATPTVIGNQLLNTARQDTIANYSAAVHGRGEASITRALAPQSIR